MQISFTKRNGRSQLFCTRKDGSGTYSNMGPDLPTHDLAHFVVETDLGLKNGFFGNIKGGRSIKQLSDKEMIKSLGSESMLAEIAARTLQLLGVGSCSEHEFEKIIRQELEHFSFPIDFKVCEDQVCKMREKYKILLEEWSKLAEGETLHLYFN